MNVIIISKDYPSVNRLDIVFFIHVFFLQSVAFSNVADIDSSKNVGKLTIYVFSVVAEIEHENIRVQTTEKPI